MTARSPGGHKRGRASNPTSPTRAKDAQRDNEERFRLFTETITDCSAVFLDGRGRIVSWDKRAEQLRGLSAGDVVGQPYAVLFPPADVRRGMPARILAHARQRGTEEGEGWRRRPDGSDFRIRYWVRALRDADGALRGYAMLCRDVTTEAKLHRAVELTRRLMDGHEVERRRVARELHDGINQLLSLAKSRLLSLMDAGRPVIAPQLEPAVRLIENAIGEVRRISRNLRPSLLDDLGLMAALRNMCDETEASYGIRCRIRAGVLPPLPKPVEDSIYRVVQEAITNAARHARADRLDLQLLQTRTGVEVCVRDNGRGMPSGIPDRNGLQNMRERAEFMGGRVTIESERFRGTTIRLQLPLTGRP